MKDTYTHEHARCDVRPSTAVDGVLEVVGVFTDAEHRGQGHGSALLREVCKDADIERRVLMLQCEAELVPFYERFGFAKIQKKPILMARMPQVYKPTFSMTALASQRVVYG